MIRGIGLLAALILAGSVGSPLAMGQTSPGHDHNSTGPTAATPEQKAAAARLLQEVKAGIARFDDFKIAEAEGYRRSTPFRFGQWGPAHFANRAYGRDGQYMDPARPRALVYMRMPDGRTVLLGAMFVAPKGQGPRPGGPLTDWHVHDNLCLTGAGTVALATGPGQCPEGSFFVGAAIEMMHVWTFDHPDGPFAHELTPAAIRAAAQYASRSR
jgi:hypothetical protein